MKKSSKLILLAVVLIITVGAAYFIVFGSGSDDPFDNLPENFEISIYQTSGSSGGSW